MPHRSPFCTHLADAGGRRRRDPRARGDADIRTTTVYTAVNDERLQDAIAGRRRNRLRLEQLNAD